MNYLVFDIGGTAIKKAIITDRGKILKKSETATPVIYQGLLSFIQESFERYPSVGGLGLSSPGVFNWSKRRLTGSSALSYLIGKPIVDDLKKLLNADIAIENDGNCALLGEHWKGNCQNVDNAAIFVVGSAVGGSLLVNGKILHGAHLNAGELGYMIIHTSPESDIFQSLGGRVGFHGMLRDIGKEFAVSNGLELFEKAKNNLQIKKWLEKRLTYLAAAIITIQYITDPEVILIGGAVSQNAEFMVLLQKEIRHTLKLRKNYQVEPKVLPALLGNDANLLGAAYNLIMNSKPI